MPETISDILAPSAPAPVVPAAPAMPSRPKALTSTLAPPPERRAFGDSTVMRKSILDNVLAAVKTKYPLENSRYRLSLDNVKYRNKKPYTLDEQKKAIMQGHSLDYQLTGNWTLTDRESGQVLDTKKGLVAHVPYATDRGTFIYKGNEYTVANQMRLKPGVFTRVKENGIIEAHFNTRQGTGPSFRLHMEPDTGIFRLNVGQSNLKLYPIMKAMGISDRELEASWGSNLLQANIKAEDPRAVQRAFAKLVATRADRETGTNDTQMMAKVSCTVEESMLLIGHGLVKSAADSAHAPVVAIDVDGTLAKQFETFDPKSIPDPRTGAKLAVKLFKSKGYKVIIWTCRSDDKVTKAWLKKHDIPYDYVNENPKQPPGISDKICADIYIDDKGIDGSASWKQIREQAISVLEKSAKIGAKETNMRWTKLWFNGHIRCEEGKDGKPWTYLEVHRGLTDSALASLKSEGIRCERSPSMPHISLILGQEMKNFIKKHGRNWRGVAGDGRQMRFALTRMTNLTPASWKDIDRVWFIEVSSPELVKWRKELKLPALPKNQDGHEHRFHITFAVHRPKAEVKRAYDLLTEKRAAGSTGQLTLEPTLAPTLEKPKAVIGDQGRGLLTTFERMELDPDVTTTTLGEKFTNVGTAALMRATKKLLNIQKGEEEVDDRDSLAYQTIHSPEDFFAERINKDAGQVGRKLLWRSTLRGNLKHVPSGVLTPQLQGVLLRSGMGMPLEEINPMDVFDQHLRVLRLGEGGIPSLDAIPDEARNVQPSHFAYIDPIRAPESAKIGVDARIAHGTYKGVDGKLYSKMNNSRTGESEIIPAELAAQSVVAFPGEMNKPGDRVRAMVRSRQVEYVSKKEVDYELPTHNQMFSASSNLVPMISNIKGGRLLMGAKFMSQALPLREAEAPLVQNLSDVEDKSFDQLYGERVGAIRATKPGVVVAMTKNNMKIRYNDKTEKVLELYNNFPFNRKTYIHNIPTVKIGDRVRPGDLLASSNYTDDKGTLAIGTNLRTAYMPYKGLNYEDAIVISEGAAKRLASEHMYQNTLDVDDNDKDIGRGQFVSIFPAKYSRQQLGSINDKGVVKLGTKVNYGDPLVLALTKTKTRGVHKGHKPLFSDASVNWEHEASGVVTDVDKTKDGGWNVTVKSFAPMQEGDKLAGRYGDKGVVSKIIPDDQMPHGADGKPFEILLNPLGINTRGNPAQLFEASLGKIARKSGEAIKVPSFTEENVIDYVEQQLARAGLTDTEDLTDPLTGRKIPEVFTGERFLMKLHHTAESKGKGRDIGAYTSEGLPAKGGEFGAKRISTMEISSLLSHGATDVLRDAQVVRGQRNDDYWRAFRLGLTPPSPKVPLIYDKFLSYLQGAGINVKKDGSRIQLFAMTDKDVGKLSSGAIQKGDTVVGDTLTPIAGGLFDEHLTGGHGGNKWTHIDLTEPMPNPLMEEPIRRMLGLTQKKYEAVISGEEPLNGKIGGLAIREALKRVRVDSAISYNEGIIKDGPRSKRDNAVKVLGYLRTMKKSGMRPEDFVMTKVPVLPPNLRPITWFKGMPLSADPNFLYRDLVKLNTDLGKMKGVVGEAQLKRERLKVYHAFKAVTGLGDPVQAKTKDKKVRGLLAHVFGSSPKVGMFQRRVLASPVDVVGRAVITPNPDLNMDQVGLPEPKAWTIYRPFIMRRLIRRGLPATEAAKAVANQTDVARKAMMEEIEERPVIINRAPTLHRYGFMAAWPVLTKGQTLQISPVLTPGFGADFDGDAMNYHVPVEDDAVKDAIERMMPSKNLKAVRDFKVHYLPKNEFLLGLYLASTAKSKGRQQRVFRSKEDVIAAHQRGELHVGDPVVVKGG